MLSYTDLKKGVLFVKDGAPHEVVESNFSRMQQRKAVVQTKIRNLVTGKIVETSFQPSDFFEEAEIQKRPVVFLYEHRGEFVFCEPDKRQNRFSLNADIIGDKKKWFKPNAELIAVFFGEKIITLLVPVKMDFKIADAPPGVQGDRAQGGTKAVTIETGALIQAPLFINAGDIIRVNTETGQYVERVEKN